jgi:cystine transport system ATP-binding protein/L-cystine transport system ATP-binding protein
MEIRKLVKSFGTNTVLHGIDLTVNKGDVVAVLGPSGSGKTTLLRCINFLEKADSGIMIFDGQSYDLGQMRRNQIAEIRQKPPSSFRTTTFSPIRPRSTT